MTIEYKLFIDVDDDGSYSEEYTTYIHSVKTSLGMNNQFDHVAPLSRATVVIDNLPRLGTELVTDGDMEAETTVAWQSQSGANLSKQTTDPKVGTRNLRVQNSPGDSSSQARQDILTAGKTYLTTGFCRAESGASASVLLGTVGVFTTNNTTWTYFDEKGTANAIFLLLAAGASGKYTEFDQISVREIIPQNDPDNLIYRKIRLQSTRTGPTTTTAWTGVIKDITISQDYTSMTLHCVGLEEPLYTQKATIPIQLNQKAGTLINLVLGQVDFRILALENVAILDHTTNGFLGKTLAGPTTPTSIDTGRLTYEYAGDRWDNTTAIAIIKDIVQSDGGRFYTTRDGTITFKDRDSLIKGSGNNFNDNALIDTGINYGGEKVNSAEVSFAGRDLGSAGSILYSAPDNLRIRPDKARKVKCRFRDANNLPAGATQIDGIVPTTNYIALDVFNNDFTDFININVISADGNSITVNIVNTSGIDLFLTKLEITGTPLSRSYPGNVIVQDVGSTNFEGKNFININAPLINNIVTAEEIALFELTRPLLGGNTYTQLIADPTLSELIADATMLDEIAITQPYTRYGDNATVNIFGEQNHILANQLPMIIYTTGYTYNIYGVLPFTLDSDERLS
jgi:hypothetical protein